MVLRYMPGPLRGRGADPPPRPEMRIEIVSAIGLGQTPISSFDDALGRCGVWNYNLIDLSSIIPPGSTVVPVARCQRPEDEFGQKLYVVRAEARSTQTGAIVAAGIAWTQWGDGRGVFVEHAFQCLDSPPEAVQAALVDHLRLAVRELCAGRNVIVAPEDICARVAIGRVGDQSTTALVLAVVQAEGWR